MEDFFCILFTIIVLTMWFRSQTRKIDPRELRRNTVKARWDRKRIKAERLKQAAKLARKAARERQQREEDEELITVILPTINNDDKK